MNSQNYREQRIVIHIFEHIIRNLHFFLRFRRQTCHLFIKYIHPVGSILEEPE